MPCVCEPYYEGGHHYVEWIAEIFHQCVYSPVQITSFCLGLFSIGCWLFAQLPQIIKTYMNGSVESLSALFLLSWLVGDITNLIGCVLTHQLPTQLYTAIYYCSMDVVMVSQLVYYKLKNRSKPNAIIISAETPEDQEKSKDGKFLYSWFMFIGIAAPMIVYTVSTGYLTTPSNTGLMEPVHRKLGRKLLSVAGFTSSQPDICDASLPLTQTERIIGDVSAWVSGLLYFGARIPQIYLNYQRKSVEGLSLPMFICAILGNVTYGLSILILGVHDWAKWMENTFPYVLGSICTLTMSSIIISQFVFYSWVPAIINRRRMKKMGTASTNAYVDDSAYYEEEDEEETNTVNSVDETGLLSGSSFRNK